MVLDKSLTSHCWPDQPILSLSQTQHVTDINNPQNVMKNHLGGTVLYASMLFHLLITITALAAPVTLGNDAEPRAHSNALIPYSGNTPVDTELFRRDPGTANANDIRGSSQTTPFAKELKTLWWLQDHINNEPKIPIVHKHAIENFLGTLAEHLKIANKGSMRYPRQEIYNTVLAIGNRVLNKWGNSVVRHAVVAYSMECLEQTKPPTGFAKLPREFDLKTLRSTVYNDLRLDARGRLKLLTNFLNDFEDILQLASRQEFSYNRLMVDQVLMDIKSMVQTFNKTQTKERILSSIDRCLAHIWVKPPQCTATMDSQSWMAGTCPAHYLSTPTSTSHSHQIQYPYLDQHIYAEQRMSWLLADPNRLENMVILPGIMEVVPDNVCIDKVDEWTRDLTQMEHCVKSLEGVGRNWALEQIERCKITLHKKVKKAKGTI